MKLIIKNFRCYKNCVFNFNNNEIILLEGNSGSGKTSVFDAISWCLYKKVPGDKSIKITPWSANLKIKTIVKLETDVAKIIRTTQPNTLKVIVNSNADSSKNILQKEETLEGHSAQCYINDWLGSYDFWILTSYIVQDGINQLIFGSSNIKSELISKICFDQNDPELFIEKGKTQLKKLESVHESLVKGFNQQVLELKSRMQRENVNDEDLHEILIIDRQYLEDLNERIDIKKAEKVRLETLIEQRNKIRDSLNKEWKNKNIEDYITELENIIEDWEKYTKWDGEKRYYNLIESELLEIKNEIKNCDSDILLSDNSDYSKSELFSLKLISSVLEAENKRKHFLETCKTIDVEYDRIIIEETKKDLLERAKKAKKDYENNNKREECLKKIDEFNLKITKLKQIVQPSPTPEILKKEIDQLKLELEAGKDMDKIKISELEQTTRKDVIKCPHCSGAVIYQRGILEKMPTIDKNKVLKEIENLKKNRDNLVIEIGSKLDKKRREFNLSTEKTKEYEESQLYIKNINDKIKSTEIPEFIENEDIEYIEALESIYYNLKNILWIEIPEISSIIMENHNMKCKLYNLIIKRDNLEEKLKNKIEENLKRPPIMKNEAMIRLKKAQHAFSKKKELNNYQKDIDERKENAEKEIDKIKEEIKNEMKRLEHIRTVNSVIEQRDKLFISKSEVDDKWNEMDKCARLVDYFIESEYQVYQYACDLINQNLINIVKDLFVDPIYVEIRTTKITASKREKPSINVYVTYNGLEVNPKDFSGGEKERLSLAMTLALTKLSTSPIIILDETFSPLSEQDREMAIKVILEHAKRNDLVTLCVGHSSVTGWYDKIIQCDKKNILEIEDEMEKLKIN